VRSSIQYLRIRLGKPVASFLDFSLYASKGSALVVRPKIFDVLKQQSFGSARAKFLQKTNNVEKEKPAVVFEPALLTGDRKWLARKPAANGGK